MLTLDQIASKLPGLSTAQKRLGHYLLTDSSALLLSNVKDLAQAVGTSKSTVVRLAKSLGYSGFPEMKRDLRREVRQRLRAATRMKEAFAEIDNERNIFAKLLKRDVELLQQTMQAASVGDFQKAVDMIRRGQRLFILGLNASTALAYLLQFRLLRVKKDARWIFQTGGSALVEQLAVIERRDLLITIGFLNVPREIQIAIHQAKKVGVPILGITDLPTSPIAKTADVCLFAKQGLHTTVNSLTPAFSIVNALGIAAAWTKKVDSIKALKNLDDLLEAYPT
jgi:DNA-binding MurR/RpiR family transcriptional regulator